MKRYEQIALLIGAVQNCAKGGNYEWKERHEDSLDEIMLNTSPSGGGIDNGTSIDVDNCTADKLVFATAFHHMDENGYYDGWTDHTIAVKPSLIGGITLRISGPNRNDIKDHLHDVYHSWLTEEETPLTPKEEPVAAILP